MAIIEKTLLLDDVKKIGQSKQTLYKSLTMELFTLGGCYKVLKIHDIVYKYDYTNNYAPEIMATILMGLNDYTTILQTDMKNIKCILYEEIEGASEQYEFDVILDRNQNPQISTNYDKQNDDRYNITNQRHVAIQLVDRRVMRLRDELCGGILRNVTVTDVLTYYYSYSINRVKSMLLDDDIRLNIHKSDNERVYPQIIVPHGMALKDLPAFLQERYGVYDYDISMYVSGNTVNIYPTYRTDQFEEVTAKVTTYCLPASLIGIPERTFRYEGASLYTINIGGLDNWDMVDIGELSGGNAVLKPNANSLLDIAGQIEGNKFKMDRGNNTLEYALSDRTDGNMRTIVSNSFSSNNHKFFSQTAIKYGKVYEFNWDSAVNRFITPGMPIKIIREYNGDYIEEYGTILGYSYSDTLKNQSFNDNTYIGTSRLRVFVKREV